jgi:putative ABC transport system substrate-binding protein
VSADFPDWSRPVAHRDAAPVRRWISPARYHVPAVYWSRSFAEVGGLISYGPYIADEYRRAALYADRILKGSKPSELPVQAPVKFELVVNLKTAKALGLDVPPSLLTAADEVID